MILYTLFAPVHVVDPMALSFLPIFMIQLVFNRLLSRSPGESLSYHLAYVDMKTILIQKNIYSIIQGTIMISCPCLIVGILLHSTVPEIFLSLLNSLSLVLTVLLRGNLTSLRTQQGIFPFKNHTHFLHILRIMILPLLMIGLCGITFSDIQGSWFVIFGIVLGVYLIVMRMIVLR